MTAKELEIKMVEMSEKEFAAFISHFDEETADILTKHRALTKLFCDVDYYNLVKQAICDQMVKELFS